MSKKKKGAKYLMKKCLTCQATKLKSPLNNWIEEKHYLGALKTEADYQKNYQGSVFYCSISCMEKQFDQEEKADWAKGNCPACNQPIVVVSDKCSDLKHQQAAHYLPITTPNCLKKGANHE